MNATFNISSDLMMICIPLPMLITSKLPRIKKAALCVLFGMGVFVILCATLNKYYSFSNPFSPQWTFWYIREASVAILIANIPNCWPLLRRLFKLKSFNGSSDGRQNTGGVDLPSRIANSIHTGPRNSARSLLRGRLQSAVRDDKGPDSTMRWSKRDRDILGRTESQTDLKDLDICRNESGSSHSVEPLEIWTKHEVTIDKEREGDNERANAIMYGGTLAASDKGQFRTKTMVTTGL